MRRALVGAAGLLVLLVGLAAAQVRLPQDFRVGTVSCGAARRVAAEGNARRTSMLLQNVGTMNIHVGSGAHLTATTGLTVHVGAALTLDNYTGPIECIADGPNQNLQVLEELEVRP